MEATSEGLTPLAIALFLGNAPAAFFLLDNNAHPDFCFPDRALTALGWSCRPGTEPAIVRRLLECGARMPLAEALALIDEKLDPTADIKRTHLCQYLT